MANYSSSSIKKTVNLALTKTFGWMSLGLSLTGSIAYLIGHSSYVHTLFREFNFTLILLIIAQIAFASIISLFFHKINYATCALLFLGYSALNGITLSNIFIIYELKSIIGIFFIAAAIFAISALYGQITKQDLSSMGHFLLMALIGIMVLMFANIFFQSVFLDKTLSFFAIIVFSGLTAYDIQKIKTLFSEMAYGTEEASKIAIFGALQMYLNYINIFLHLLRLLGKKKQ